VRAEYKDETLRQNKRFYLIHSELPFMCKTGTTYNVYIPQLIRHPRACDFKHDEEFMLTRTLTVPNVPTSYVEVITSKVLRSRRHHDLVKRCLCTNDHDMFGVL